MVPSGSAALDGVRNVGRDMFGRFQSGARRFGQGMVSRSAAASAALSRAQGKDTLGGLVARSVGPGAVALGAGVLDGSRVGEWVNEKTGGWLDASTAALAAGGIAHAFRLDGWLHPGLRSANRTMLSGLIPVWLYKRGLGIPDIVSGRLGDGARAEESAPRLSGTPEPSSPAPEPIPGETTVS